jgi:3-methyl-2-oxobutanoate hydroxymethyltransferase
VKSSRGRAIADLLQMKRDGRKIVAAVLYDYQMAQIADRAGVDVVSIGDSVGVAMWGYESETDVTVDEMLLVCRAVRRGVERALVSCDAPLAALRDGTAAAVEAATRLAHDGGADLVKVDADASSADVVHAIVTAGIPVWAQLSGASETDAAAIDRLVARARRLEQAGASLLDFRHSGPAAGPAVVASVAVPVIGGLGGGPWLDGRVRSIAAALGYLASAAEDGKVRYANVAATALNAIEALCDDVRAARPLKGE